MTKLKAQTIKVTPSIHAKMFPPDEAAPVQHETRTYVNGDVFDFGKYNGVKGRDVVRIDPGYIVWMREIATKVDVSDDLYSVAKRRMKYQARKAAGFAARYGSRPSTRKIPQASMDNPYEGLWLLDDRGYSRD